jgi:hypothetical protein
MKLDIYVTVFIISEDNGDVSPAANTVSTVNTTNDVSPAATTVSTVNTTNADLRTLK